MILSEYIQAVTVSTMAFLIGIYMRERCRQDLFIWCGRACVFAALINLAGFGYHATERCEQYLAAKPIEQQSTPARGISEPQMIAEQPEWTLTTESGNVVTSNGDGTYGVRTGVGGSQSSDRTTGWAYRGPRRGDFSGTAGEFGGGGTGGDSQF